MKALTTLMALFTILALASFNEAPALNTPGSSDSAVSAPPEAPDKPDRPIPDSARPWFADYPLTTDIDGARVYASDQGRIEDVAWALAQFAAAGIELPHVEVWTHADVTGCRFSLENDALFAGVFVQRRGVDTVYLCGTRFTMLHELAHVHDNNYLSDAERNEFLAIRDADSWRNNNWNRAAGEHFADVMAWGLTGGEVRPSRSFPNDDASLQHAFDLALSISS
jgi:hypothetical protein